MRLFYGVLLCLLPFLSLAADKLSRGEYVLLKEGFSLMEENKFDEAYQYFKNTKLKIKKDYGLALIQHNLGQIELQRENYKSALTHLKSAYDYNKLAVEQQVNVMFTLAQLYCMEEKWQSCIDFTERWMQQASPKKIKGTDYIMLAQAYSQLDQWDKVNKPVVSAIAGRKVAPKNWYQLKVAAHIRLKQWQDGIKTQKIILTHYPSSPASWRHLVSMQLYINDDKAALASQRMAFEQGILSLEKDYRLLAQLMIEAKIPYFAGLVIEKGIENGVLESNSKNLNLLSYCWINSREPTKAINVLKQLISLSPSRQYLTQLAQMQIDLQQWKAANSNLKKVLKISNKNKENLQLLLAITQIKLKKFDQAQHSLKLAAHDKNLRLRVNNWRNYLKQLKV